MRDLVNLPRILNLIYNRWLIPSSTIVVFWLEYFDLIISVGVCLHGLLVLAIRYVVNLVVDASDHGDCGSYLLGGDWSHAAYGSISSLLFILMFNFFEHNRRLLITIIDTLGILNNLNLKVLMIHIGNRLIILLIILSFFRRLWLGRFCVQRISFYITVRRFSVSSIEFRECTLICVIIFGLLVFNEWKLTWTYPYIRHFRTW